MVISLSLQSVSKKTVLQIVLGYFEKSFGKSKKNLVEIIKAPTFATPTKNREAKKA
jgi:ribose 5-phosphate isomerase RpiB